MDTKRIKELIALARRKGIGELEFGEGSMKVTFKLKSLSSEISPASQTRGDQPEKARDAESAKEQWIRSPMVGLFRPHDGSVSEGSTVSAGDIIGHIESMGILNEITSDVAGVVTRVEIGDGDPVEYGQPLVLVKPAPQPSSEESE